MIKPTFTNYAGISHTEDDFYFDFIQLFPGPLGKLAPSGEPNGEVVARVTMSPIQAKRVLEALATSIATYEAKGKPIGEVPPMPPKGLFN